MKRRMRALIRARLNTIPPVDMILEIRHDIRDVPFPELGERFDRLLKQVRRPC